MLLINNLLRRVLMSISTFKAIPIAAIVSSFVLLSGCSSPQEKAADSQVEINERKMEIVDRYEACIEKAETAEDQATCEQQLKAAEGL
jgi:outer membrane murein-binding lipoprotein Lpp